MGYHVHDVLQVKASEFPDAPYYVFFFSPRESRRADGDLGSDAEQMFWRFANSMHEQSIVLWDQQHWADVIFTHNLPPYISAHAFWYNPIVVVTLGQDSATRFQQSLARQYTSHAANRTHGVQDWDRPSWHPTPPAPGDSPFMLPDTYIITFPLQPKELVEPALLALSRLMSSGKLHPLVATGGAKKLGCELANALQTKVGIYKNAIFFNPDQIREWYDVDNTQPFEVIYDEAENLLECVKHLSEAQRKYLEEYISALEVSLTRLYSDLRELLSGIAQASQRNTAATEELLAHVERESSKPKVQVKAESSVGLDFLGSGIKGTLEISKDISDRTERFGDILAKVEKAVELLERLRSKNRQLEKKEKHSRRRG